jgi:LacI family transcriptional regulator
MDVSLIAILLVKGHSMGSKRKIRVALIWDKDAANSIIASEIFRGVGRHVSGKRIEIRTNWVATMPDIALPFFPDFRREGVDGALMRSEDARHVETILEQNIPVIHIERQIREPSLPYIESDGLEIGRLVADHLMGQGYRHFAWLGLDPRLRSSASLIDPTHWSNQRQIGFVDRLRAKGRECEVFSKFKDLHPGVEALDYVAASKEYFAAVCKWLRKLPRPLGVMCGDDRMGAMLVRACSHLSLRVPHDVGVMGAGNNPTQYAICNPPLSSVDFDFEQIGWRAMDLLERAIQGEAPPRASYSPPKGVVARESTNHFDTKDSSIKDAISYLRENYQRRVTIRNLAEITHLSRRHLSRLFKEETGGTIVEELRRLRLEHAASLLKDTKMRIEEVARACGFRNANYLSRVFTEEYGIPPAHWRREFPFRTDAEQG